MARYTPRQQRPQRLLQDFLRYKKIRLHLAQRRRARQTKQQINNFVTESTLSESSSESPTTTSTTDSTSQKTVLCRVLTRTLQPSLTTGLGDLRVLLAFASGFCRHISGETSGSGAASTIPGDSRFRTILTLENRRQNRRPNRHRRVAFKQYK
ncbi:hypothetical protein P692DRAFT_20861378 [Suillus brevipes Sb2]|nr:hypothetical protein P692DRAFT_20861378 [Suillus brevipes Sb2]